MEAIGDAIEALINIVLFFLIPLSILGIWKLVEILIWVVNNVSVTFS